MHQNTGFGNVHTINIQLFQQKWIACILIYIYKSNYGSKSIANLAVGGGLYENILDLVAKIRICRADISYRGECNDAHPFALQGAHDRFPSQLIDTEIMKPSLGFSDTRGA